MARRKQNEVNQVCEALGRSLKGIVRSDEMLVALAVWGVLCQFDPLELIFY
jgi:hypothetical protein